MAEAGRPLVGVADLRVRFPTPRGPIDAVRGVSFTLGAERLDIVGESGSGRSTLGRALLQLVPPPDEVAAERLVVDDIDVLRADPGTLRELSGGRASVVLQDPNSP